MLPARKGWRISFALLALAGIASLVLILRMQSRGIRVDWDIDTFIAISQSWLGGNNIYIDFFDPKWPHVQWIYVPAAISQSLKVHLIASWLAIVGTGAAITSTALMLKEGVNKKTYIVSSGAIYVAITPLLPGGNIGQLEIYSNLLAAISISFAARCISNKRESSISSGYMFLSGIAAGISCGIRPNLIVPALLLLISTIYLYKDLYRGKHTFIALGCGWMSGVLLPFFPYLFTEGGMAKAFAGAVGILGPWKEAMYSTYSISSFGAEVFTLLSPRILGINFALILFALLAIAIFGLLRMQSRRRSAILLASSWLAGLYLSYWVSHIHHHYILMDFFGVCIILSLGETGLSPELRKKLVAFSMGCCLIILFYPLKDLSTGDSRYLMHEEAILQKLRESSSDRFSAPEWISLHWKRGETIQTTGIHPVWSIGVTKMPGLRDSEPSKLLGLDNSLAYNCNIWKAPGIATVVMSDSLANDCGMDSDIGWHNISKLLGLPKKSEVNIFVREIPPQAN